MLIKVDFENTSIHLGNKKIELHEYYSNKAEEFMLEYSRIKYEIGKYFVIDNINYAELITYFFYQNDNYFNKAPGIITILNYIEVLDQIKEKSELTLEISDLYYETFKKCAELVSMKKKFRLKILQENYVNRNMDFIYNNPFFVKNLLKIRISLRYIFGLIRKILGKHDNTKADVIMLGTTRFEGNLPKDNIFFGGVIAELDREKIKNKIIKYEDLIQLVTLKNFIKRIFLKKQAYIGDYYTLNHFLECDKDFNSLKIKWENIKNDSEFKNIFTYKGYNYYDIIKPKLELTFNALSYIACDIKNISKNINEIEKYKVLLLDHEENIYGKSFMLINRTNVNRKTLALSFEIIWKGGVHISIKNTIIQNKNSLMWRPLPDIKCVWSKHSEEILTKKCNYPKKIIKITGNPRFDLPLKTKYNTKKIIEKYNLSKTKKKILCVLWSPGGISDINYLDELNIISKEIGNLEFIIKPHPRDINIKRIKKKIKIFNNQLIKYANNIDDIYPLIHVSDYVLTNGTTVGFESLLKNKITFGWFHKEDKNLPPFLRGVIQIEELSMIINELKKLSNKINLRKALNKTKTLRERYHYKNDGLSSKRVTSEIKHLISSEKY